MSRKFMSILSGTTYNVHANEMASGMRQQTGDNEANAALGSTNANGLTATNASPIGGRLSNLSALITGRPLVPISDTIKCIVHFLDDTEHVFEVDRSAKGEELMDAVFRHLELIEREYFALQYTEIFHTASTTTSSSSATTSTTSSPINQNQINNNQNDDHLLINHSDLPATTKSIVYNKWLDPMKKIRKQMRFCQQPYLLHFRVKFYVTDIQCLLEEYTRYHFYLQIRKDILSGHLCQSNNDYDIDEQDSIMATLASYVLQSELGDYSEDEHQPGYSKEFRFIPRQTDEFCKKIEALHRLHRGQTPADAELNYLEEAKHLELYGVDLHNAKDCDNIDIKIGVSSNGLTIYKIIILNQHQQIKLQKINMFSWAKIVKISFKRRYFFIQLKHEGTERFDNLIGFNLCSYRACKSLWKSCVEQHTFFRLHTPKPLTKKFFFFFSLGSKYRYSGKTEYQTIEENRRRLTRTERIFIRNTGTNSTNYSTMPTNISSSKPLKMSKSLINRNDAQKHLKNLKLSTLDNTVVTTVAKSSAQATTTAPTTTTTATINGCTVMTTHKCNMQQQQQQQRVDGINAAGDNDQSKHKKHQKLKSLESIDSIESLISSSSSEASSSLFGKHHKSSKLNNDKYKTLDNVNNMNSNANNTNNTNNSHNKTVLTSLSFGHIAPRSNDNDGSKMSKSIKSKMKPSELMKSNVTNNNDTSQINQPKKSLKSMPSLSSSSTTSTSSLESSFMPSVMNNNDEKLVESNDCNDNRIINSAAIPAAFAPSTLTSLPYIDSISTSSSDKTVNSATIINDGDDDNNGKKSNVNNNDLSETSTLIDDNLKFDFDLPIHELIKELYDDAISTLPTNNDETNDGINDDNKDDLNENESPIHLIQITMRPDEQGRFGFNLKGGNDQNCPVLISRILPNTPAAMAEPKLHEGDQVIAINGVDVNDLKHEQVVQLIRSTKDLNIDDPKLILSIRPNVYYKNSNSNHCIHGDNDDVHDDDIDNNLILNHPICDPEQSPFHYTLVNYPLSTIPSTFAHQSQLSTFVDDHDDDINPEESGDDDDDHDNDLLKMNKYASGSLLETSMNLLHEGLHGDLLIIQFEYLPRRNEDESITIARLLDNVPKNRYLDIAPYDSTRVILKECNSGDYINASFVTMKIDASNVTNRYIATQGPLKRTTSDFWQMVWEQKSTLIVMVTPLIEDGRKKCFKYWPDEDQTMIVNDLLDLTLLDCVDRGAFLERRFKMIDPENKNTHYVTHLQYLAWPDQGVPDDDTDFLKLIFKVRELRQEAIESPVIVHCSAGIGRTGVLILMETGICLIEANQPVYPLELVRIMRNQRAMLIQTSTQFRFVCEALHRVYRDQIVRPLPQYLPQANNSISGADTNVENVSNNQDLDKNISNDDLIDDDCIIVTTTTANNCPIRPVDSEHKGLIDDQNEPKDSQINPDNDGSDSNKSNVEDNKLS